MNFINLFANHLALNVLFSLIIVPLILNGMVAPLSNLHLPSNGGHNAGSLVPPFVPNSNPRIPLPAFSSNLIEMPNKNFDLITKEKKPKTELMLPSSSSNEDIKKWKMTWNWIYPGMMVEDETTGKDAFEIDKNLFALTAEYDFTDLTKGTKKHLAKLKQHAISWLPAYSIYMGEKDDLYGEIDQKWTWFFSEFEIKKADGSPPIIISSNWWGDKFTFKQKDEKEGKELEIATVKISFFSARTTFSLEVNADQNQVLILASCIAIERSIHSHNKNGENIQLAGVKNDEKMQEIGKNEKKRGKAQKRGKKVDMEKQGENEQNLANQ